MIVLFVIYNSICIVPQYKPAFSTSISMKKKYKVCNLHNNSLCSFSCMLLWDTGIVVQCKQFLVPSIVGKEFFFHLSTMNKVIVLVNLRSPHQRMSK